MTTPIYQIQSLIHVYGGKTVLEIDHLEVQPGAIVGLIGPNGSGKSSLLRLLGLIEKPTRGTIHFNGHPVEPFSDEDRFQITLLPQEPFLLKRSVLKNVCYGLKLRGNRKHAIQKALEALALVGLDGQEFARRQWYALSGGEAQRVALAARLALSPEVLLLDEPTTGVDAASAEMIKEAFLWARRELGTTLIIASHDWQWLYEICDEMVHLFRGKLFQKEQQPFIFGPWQNLGAGKWAKILSDRQQLRVPPPPQKNGVAVLNGLALKEKGPRATNGKIVLTGTVSRLSLEGKTGRIFASILVGDLSLTVVLTTEQQNSYTIFPGQKIDLQYSLDRIKWL